VRRNKRGTSFVESHDVGRSLAADRRKRAKTKVKSGYGDKGDRSRPKTKRNAASKSRKKEASRKGALGSLPAKKGRSATSSLPDFISFATCLLVDRRPTGPIGFKRSSWMVGACRFV
jgi:hypothetical protein